MTDLTCPICGTVFSDEKYRVAERLGRKGYFHLDIWVKCPTCKYTPAFGRELSDAKPVYWRPTNLPLKFRRMVEAAFHKNIPLMHCPFPNCASELELHKIWVHTWKQDQPIPDGQTVRSDAPTDVREAFQFIVSSSDRKEIGKYFIPAGIMAQYKCVNQACKYVRYVTL